MPIQMVEHPLVQDALAQLRDVRTEPEAFRRQATRISLLLAAEATRDLPTVPVTLETPLGSAAGRRLTRDIVIVPVLRAGLGMLGSLLELLPGARVGHIGLERDEATGEAAQYYAKLPPNLARSCVLVIDPMLATGGSAVASLEVLRDAGARDVRLVCIVAAPEGISRLERHDPDIRIFTPVIDSRLDARRFIVPGLGDFGDRLYGTT